MMRLAILAVAVAAFTGWAWQVQYDYGMAVALLIPFAVCVYMANVSKGGLSSFFTTAATIAVCLSVAEFGLFLMALSDKVKQPITGSYTATAYRAPSPWGFVPVEGVYAAARNDADGVEAYSVTYTIGPDGFRATPVDGASDEVTFFMGGSFIFGEGLENDQTLPYYFAQASEGTGVKNFGVHGYGMHQALKILRLRLAEDIDRIVAMTIPWHAERSACISLFANGSPRFMRQDGELVEVGRCGLRVPRTVISLLSRSRLFALGRDALQTTRRDRDGEFVLYLDILKELQAISRDKFSAQFLVAFIKSKEDYFAGTSYSNEILVDALREADIDVLDVTLADREEDVGQEYMIKGDGHPSALANQARAALLVEHLLGDE